MTSSLVGSEMCIRDRQQLLEPDIGGDPLVDVDVGGAALPGSEVPSDSEAVSYTHLTLPTICSV
eukprot:7998453-Prorocentrum_lima.AAC.1